LQALVGMVSAAKMRSLSARMGIFSTDALAGTRLSCRDRSRRTGVILLGQAAVALFRAGERRMSEDEKIDLNDASVVQLKAIKGLGKSRAEEIARYRGRRGRFASVDELDRVPHVGDMPVDELARLKAQFVVRLAEGEAPPTAPAKVDLNRANVEELRAIEGIGLERAEEIVRHREEHGPFRDLADLDALPHFRDEPEGQRGPIKARLKL
jgi:competence ComEA-like helix-hairpin-helix protein